MFPSACFARYEQCTGRIEENCIAITAIFSIKQATQGCRIESRISAPD